MSKTVTMFNRGGRRWFHTPGGHMFVSTPDAEKRTQEQDEAKRVGVGDARFA